MTECLLCGKVWDGSPNETLPCFAEGMTNSEWIRETRGGKFMMRPLQEVRECHSFLEVALKGPLPEDLRERFPVLKGLDIGTEAKEALVRGFSLMGSFSSTSR